MSGLHLRNIFHHNLDVDVDSGLFGTLPPLAASAEALLDGASLEELLDLEGQIKVVAAHVHAHMTKRVQAAHGGAPSSPPTEPRSSS